MRLRARATACSNTSSLTMPDPRRPGRRHAQPKYQITPQARLLCQIMEKVERRELKRVGVSIGPQMGKSQILSRGAPAWMTGRNPALNMILGSYNQDFANEFGDDVRAIVNSRRTSRCSPSTSCASAARRSRCSSPTRAASGVRRRRRLRHR
jgi:hypothetical protein